MPPQIITAVLRDGAVHADDASVVPWWSYTKTVLAAAALRLVSRGLLHLDEPVPGHFFTLRQLLQHRAGLVDYGAVPEYHAAVAAGDTPWPVEDMLRKARADRLAYQPGESWGYSNIGYLFVRRLLEEKTGALLGPALAELVLEPLGIEHVTVAIEPDDLKPTAWGNAAGYHPGWVYHGLLIGPAASAALLLHRLLDSRLFPEPLLEEMLRSHPLIELSPERPWQSAGYGLGLMTGTGGDRAARYTGHTGMGPGSTAAVYQCDTGNTKSRNRTTAAAFAMSQEAGTVERKAMALAICDSA